MGDFIVGLSPMFIVGCGVLGLLGQFIHSLIGWYKLCMDETRTFKENFSLYRVIIGLVIGVVVGALVSLFFNPPLNRQDALFIIAMGYGGTDALEGFLKKFLEKKNANL